MRCVTGKEEGFNEGFGVSGGDLGGGIFWSEGLVQLLSSVSKGCLVELVHLIYVYIWLKEGARVYNWYDYFVTKLIL